MRLHRLVWVYTCQNATLLEITCRGSNCLKDWNQSSSSGEISDNLGLRSLISASSSRTHEMSRVATKPVFGVSDKAGFKPVSSDTKTIKKIENSLIESSDMMLPSKQKVKALIRLRECAGWSAPLLFANHWRRGFSRRGPNFVWSLYHEKAQIRILG